MHLHLQTADAERLLMFVANIASWMADCDGIASITLLDANTQVGITTMAGHAVRQRIDALDFEAAKASLNEQAQADYDRQREEWFRAHPATPSEEESAMRRGD